MSDIRPALVEQLILHEGLRLKPYLDTVGKSTIGVGRNLDDIGITKAEALYLLDNDITRVEGELDHHWPWWRARPDAVRRVMVDMDFNLGPSRLRGFKQALAAIERGDYRAAATHMLDSKWAGQVGKRAVTLADMMRGVG